MKVTIEILLSGHSELERLEFSLETNLLSSFIMSSMNFLCTIFYVYHWAFIHSLIHSFPYSFPYSTIHSDLSDPYTSLLFLCRVGPVLDWRFNTPFTSIASLALYLCVPCAYRCNQRPEECWIPWCLWVTHLSTENWTHVLCKSWKSS